MAHMAKEERGKEYPRCATVETGFKKEFLKKRKDGRMVRRKGRKEGRRAEARGLTKGLSSLAGGGGRPCFGCLPFGRVNSDPGQERKRKSSERKVKEQTGRLEGQKYSRERLQEEPGGTRRWGGSDPRCEEDFYIRGESVACSGLAVISRVKMFPVSPIEMN